MRRNLLTLLLWLAGGFAALAGGWKPSDAGQRAPIRRRRHSKSTRSASKGSILKTRRFAALPLPRHHPRKAAWRG